MDFIIEEKKLTDKSIAYNVVAKEDEDDEDEEGFEIWAAPSESAALSAKAALTFLMSGMEMAQNDEQRQKIAAKVMQACA